jgi:predicted lactoylglutathione lyase
MSKQVENTIPVLPVKDLKRSKEFYVQKLGFQLDWGDSEDAAICQVSRDDHPIMLTEDRKLGSPACVWVGLESDKLFKEFMDKGVTVLSKPANKPWAHEMRIQDVDGNTLWLGTEPRD